MSSCGQIRSLPHFLSFSSYPHISLTLYPSINHFDQSLTQSRLKNVPRTDFPVASPVSLNTKGHVPTYKRLREIPVVKSCQIKLGIEDVSLQLGIPHFEIVQIDSRFPSAAINTHSSFRALIQPEKAGDTKEIYERCRAEVAAINLFFPDIQAEATQLCMAAWLAANCAADDFLESMPLASGIAALKETISNLQENKEDISPDNGVARILFLFQSYCSQHLDLSEDVYHELRNDMCDMCQGLLDELLFRQGVLPNTLDTYLQFRGRTMGIHPFFTLIRAMYSPIGNKCLSELRDLQMRVSLVLGLQNDLVGLEKDRRKGETMNAVLVSLNEQAGTDVERMDSIMPVVIQDVCGIHNRCVSAAVEKYHLMVESNGEVQNPVLETAVLAFADTHLKWCASSKRYQAKVQ
ncbi:unnamed protein product [Penicillium salamii]|uniref:Terpenoid synthase n=1 Tax=Penicillium salamii TaxID=1612424 RepID=A0A9W4J367_9EURO|nr:unnamed protein product [Penicillium salamii]